MSHIVIVAIAVSFFVNNAAFSAEPIQKHKIPIKFSLENRSEYISIDLHTSHRNGQFVGAEAQFDWVSSGNRGCGFVYSPLRAFPVEENEILNIEYEDTFNKYRHRLDKSMTCDVKRQYKVTLSRSFLEKIAALKVPEILSYAGCGGISDVEVMLAKVQTFLGIDSDFSEFVAEKDGKVVLVKPVGDDLALDVISNEVLMTSIYGKDVWKYSWEERPELSYAEAIHRCSELEKKYPKAKNKKKK